MNTPRIREISPESPPQTDEEDIDILTDDGEAWEDEEEEEKQTTARIKTVNSSVITKVSEKLNDTNWATWREDMLLMLEMSDVGKYVSGRHNCPDPSVDPTSAKNWKYNNNYTKLLINTNITPSQ